MILSLSIDILDMEIIVQHEGQSTYEIRAGISDIQPALSTPPALVCCLQILPH